MPYVEVWVDEAACGPCEECERRKEQDEQEDSDLKYLVAEWVRAKELGDFQYFDEVVQKVRPALLYEITYGKPTFATRQN